MRQNREPARFPYPRKRPLRRGNDKLIHPIRQAQLFPYLLHLPVKLLPVGFDQPGNAVTPAEIHDMLTPLHRMHLLAGEQSQIKRDIRIHCLRFPNGVIIGVIADRREIHADPAALRGNMGRSIFRRMTAAAVRAVLVEVAAIRLQTVKILFQRINPECGKHFGPRLASRTDQVNGMLLFSGEKSFDHKLSVLLTP